jgi:VWFA-related protein
MLWPPVLTAQDSLQAETTFTSNSELVLVPVQVVDHAGRPLHGLKQDEFVLKSDGKPQHIGLFEEIQPLETPKAPLILASASDAPPAATPGKFSNLQANAIPQQLFIVAIDNVNTPIQLQSWARDQLVRYLRNNPPHQPMEIVALTPAGLLRVHEPTTDTAALIESIRKVHSRLGPQDSPEPLLSRMDRTGRIDSYASLVNQVQQNQALAASAHLSGGMLTLRTFEQMAWAYSGIPGRKTVLWLTTGFPLMPEVPDGPAMLGRGPARLGLASTGQHRTGELLPEFQRAFTALSKANVMVYPVDVAGLPLESMWDISQPAGLYIHPELAHLSGYQLPDTSGEGRDGMKEMASRTGGKSCTAGNNLAVCLNQALSESSDYYLLGFYVSQQQRKAGWHKLKVSVSAGHGEVRSRNSYYLRTLGPPQPQEQQDGLLSAMYAPVDYTGILFTVEPGTQAPIADATIPFKVAVPATSIVLQPGQDKLSFDVIAIPLSTKGLPVFKQSRIVKLDITPAETLTALRKGWSLVNVIPGDKSIAAVKIVIRDNSSGRIGSVMFPVTRPGS